MIRRDYIMRMIEEFARVLSRINRLKREQKWGDADQTIDEEFQRWFGMGAAVISQLPETDLLARLIEGEPVAGVRSKTLLLATLLQQAGDVAAGQHRVQDAEAFYLKGLHILLSVLSQTEDQDWPEFVPKAESFLSSLAGASLPMRTVAMLMRHYEELGEFGKAEDALFTLLQAAPDDLALVPFGIAFYERLLTRPDDTLTRGNLPRDEVEAGRNELKGRLERNK